MLATVVIAAGWSAGVVSAHAEVIGVDPPAGTVLPATPDEVTVTFTEPVSLSGGNVELFDATGASIPVEASVVDRTVHVDLPATLDDGTYLVAWRVISADSHPVSGTSTFSVGAPSAGGVTNVDLGGGAPVAASVWRIIAMAFTYGGVLVAVGLWWYSRRWHSAALHEPDENVVGALDRLDVWCSISALVGFVALIAAFPARLVTVGGDWSALTDGSFVTDNITGPIGLATAVTLVGLLGLVLCRPRDGSPARLAFGLLATVFALGGFAVEGHTRTKEPTWLIMLSDFVHTAAGSVWLGGVVALALMLRRTTGRWRTRIAVDVSWGALWAVIAVSAAGIAMSVIVLPSFNALADTSYGQALLVKIGLVLILLAIGARNRLSLVPDLETATADADPTHDGSVDDRSAAAGPAARLRRSVVAELVVFTLLLVATATLVGRSPVVADDAPTGIAPVSAPLSPIAGTVTATVSPGAVGANIIELTLLDDTGAPLAVIEPPAVELREETRGIGPLTLSAEDRGDGSFYMLADIPFVGDWTLTVRARTGTFDSTSAVVEFPIDR